MLITADTELTCFKKFYHYSLGKQTFGWWHTGKILRSSFLEQGDFIKEKLRNRVSRTRSI